MAQPPDPLEEVRVLKSDFDLLQAAANAAMEDFTDLCELLQLEKPPTMAPREFMRLVVLPMIAHLMTTQQQVDEASQQVLDAASRYGNKTKDFGKGVQGIKVGERQTGLFGPGT